MYMTYYISRQKRADVTENMNCPAEASSECGGT